MASSDLETVASWMAAQGHGDAEQTVPLKGTLVLSDGQSAQPVLCQTDKGVWLVGTDGTNGRAIDLCSVWPLGWDRGLLNDALVVGAERWVVPTGHGAEARAALATGRVYAKLGAAHRPVTGPGGEAPSGPWCDPMEPAAEAVVGRLIGDGDFVLAWLPTAVTRSPERAAADAKGPVHLLVTRDSQWLVTVTPLGDTDIEQLDSDVSVSQTSPELLVGTAAYELDASHLSSFTSVVALVGLAPGPRQLEAASMLARMGRRGRVMSDRLLDRLVGSRDPAVLLARAARQEHITPDALDRLAEGCPLSAEGGTALANWVGDWSPSADLAAGLLARLLERAETTDEAKNLLGLHRSVRTERLRASQDHQAETEADVSLAEHLLFAGEREEARVLLEQRLAALPSADLLAVAPPEEADLCAGEGAPPLHLRVLELLVHARSGDDDARQAINAIARYQPLLPNRVVAVIDSSSGETKRRAERTLEVLTGDALIQQTPLTARKVRTLPDAIQERLQHPSTREGGALGKMQAALASVAPPDASLVRSYCERLTDRRHPDAATAIAEAAVMLGMPMPQTFISRGERDVGLRSHEKPSPFLLIGGSHLDPDSDHYLGPAELRFAVGAELTHLHFGYSRVSSNDVWAGVWDKTTLALGATATLMPVLRFLPTNLLTSTKAMGAVRSLAPQKWLSAIYEVEGAAGLAKRLGADPSKLVQAGATAADTATGGKSALKSAADRFLPSDAIPTDLSVDQARLVVAHRVMQLTADRAGLVLAGDLGAALRSIFTTHSRLRPELSLARSGGLLTVLRRKTPEGTPLLPNLAVRAAALIAFWLSEEYQVLQDSIMAPEHDAPASDAPEG